MNVLLCESHYRSRSWIQSLKSYPHLYLLSIMPEEYKLHLKNHFKKSRICNLTPNAIQKNHIGSNLNKKVKYLKEFENKHKINLNYIILMDRTLRKKSYNLTINYIYNVITTQIRFLNKNKINLVFMEPTWFHEIILCEIAKIKKIPVYAPVRDKLLKNKFYFFKGYNRNEFFVRSPNAVNDLNVDKLDDFLKNEPPFFSYFNNRNKLDFNKLMIFFRILRLSVFRYKNSFIQPTLFWSLKTKILDIFRKTLFNFILNFYHPNLKEKFILIPLHVQPEAGIDVIGEKFSNQLEFIRQIVRTLPTEILIFVKEHPHDFGRRNLDFYENLHKIPAVKLIHPSFSNKSLLKSTELVISVAGTSSLEAALLKKSAVTAVKSHFHFLMVQPTFDPYVESVKDLLTKSKKHLVTNAKITKFYSNTKSNLFDGNTMDCKTDPSVLDQKNLLYLKKAFLEVIMNLKIKNV